MSRFLSKRFSSLEPYVPGEQPRERKFIKLNTNESPFPPSAAVVRAAALAAESLQLYSDPSCLALHKALANAYGVKPSQVLAGNGSDELLYFAFTAFCDADTPAVFPDITYGFYPVFAQLCNVEARIIPLSDGFFIRADNYYGAKGTIFIANPNAPTGIMMPLSDVLCIARRNPDNVVVIDEAYVDFGGKSAVSLLKDCPNLLIIQTFSKSRSLAGGRLGFALGSEELIADLAAVKYSFNPYSVNSMTMAAGLASLAEPEVTRANCACIIANREFTVDGLTRLGFSCLPSCANFVFARHASIPGETVFRALRQRGILVRHFNKERLEDYNRITIGSRAQMEALLSAMGAIVGSQEGANA